MAVARLVAGGLPIQAPPSPRGPEEADGGGPRQALLDELRARIGALVARPDAEAAGPAPPARSGASPAIRRLSFTVPPPVPALGLGLGEVDGTLPAGGLEAHGLHEIKPASARDWPAALALALALAGRHAAGRGRSVLWAAQSRGIRETGRLYGLGLPGLGLPPGAILGIEASRAEDVLWAMEEGLRSGALAAVVGMIDKLAVTPARRLVLAAAQAVTPCLVVSGHAGDGLSHAHSRWRVAGAPAAPHAFDATAPGAWRLRLTLERCRRGPSGLSWTLEWCDATHRFRLAAPLADREVAASEPRRGAG